ncbi:MAG TPA: hypothetical protein VF121_03275 [Thermoanaerobaculia bacterium]|nr:hypothetical protein [Thermoanaerobaculia bacterium]
MELVVRCKNHPEVTEGCVRCARCGDWFCPDCRVELGGRPYCAECKVEYVRGLQAGVPAGKRIIRAGELDVAGLALAYRQLVLWFGAQLVLSLAWLGLEPVAEGGAGAILAFGVSLGLLATAFALAYYAYRTATALGSKSGVLWAIAMLVPCVNMITLLVLSSKATQACRANGIPVGFFGPKVDAASGDKPGLDAGGG